MVQWVANAWSSGVSSPRLSGYREGQASCTSCEGYYLRTIDLQPDPMKYLGPVVIIIVNLIKVNIVSPLYGVSRRTYQPYTGFATKRQPLVSNTGVNRSLPINIPRTYLGGPGSATIVPRQLLFPDIVPSPLSLDS